VIVIRFLITALLFQHPIFDLSHNLIVFGFLIVALCIQHPIHEFSHVIAARLCGEKITRIQWLTYNGGTRVLYENEPDSSSEKISKKWLFISGAGFITTTILGYLFTILYFVASNDWLKLLLFAFSFVFLFCDSLYFLGGSIGNFGDVVGVRETIKISRKLSILLCDAAFAFHLVIIIRCFCFPI
jgi:hypothetical protein